MRLLRMEWSQVGIAMAACAVWTATAVAQTDAPTQTDTPAREQSRVQPESEPADSGTDRASDEAEGATPQAEEPPTDPASAPVESNGADSETGGSQAADTQTGDSTTTTDTSAAESSVDVSTGNLSTTNLNAAGPQATTEQTSEDGKDSSKNAEPATKDGPWTFLGAEWKPHAQVRERLEIRINNYAPGPNDSSEVHFVTSRARVGLEVNWSAVRLFTQLQDARNLGAAPPADNSNASTGMHQGYVELRSPCKCGWLRLGRQEINYGDERLIGALDWTQPARSFDALRVHLGNADSPAELDMFGSILRDQQRFEIVTMAPDGTETTSMGDSNGDYLAGMEFSWRPVDFLTIQPYLIYRHDGPIADNPTRDRDIASPGLRITSPGIGGFFYTLDGTLQFGKVGTNNHFAYGFAGDVGYKIDSPARPAISAGVALASGGSSAGEDADQFENFFPTNHKFYGYVDLFGWRNIIEEHIKVALKPKSLPFTATFFIFNFGLQDGDAPWTNAGGAVLGQSDESGSNQLGQEIDFVLSWKPLPGVGLSGGYGLFIPNKGSKRLGNEDPTHWMYLMFGGKMGS